ncbi:MAG: hypothetical protein ACE5I8_02735 [Thermodesulfobacteriota bacterium]
MTGCERQVLGIVSELKEANKEAVSRKMGVSSKYVTELCDSLMKDGYLLKASQGEYLISVEGKRALQPFKGRSQGTPMRGMGGIAVSIYP